METVFVNLVRGNRLSALIGLKLPEGLVPKYGPQYQYVEIPVKCFRKDDGSELDEAKANQHLEVIPNCTIQVRGSQPVMIHYNPALQAVGTHSGSHIVWPGGDAHIPSFYVSFRKATSLSDVAWAIRISLLA
jgi:hypothetical protein